jgi:hypothetical protein
MIPDADDAVHTLVVSAVVTALLHQQPAVKAEALKAIRGLQGTPGYPDQSRDSLASVLDHHRIAFR